MAHNPSIEKVDIVLVGGGIMSATLGNLVKHLMPNASVQVFERLHRIAFESSQSMNNAGTGHAGNCEMNYTPADGQGGVDITKALSVNAAYETSLQFWSSLVEAGDIANPREFLNAIPHLALVWGEDNVQFLQRRQEAMSAHPMYADMQITADHSQLLDWAPLTMDGRVLNQTVAATRVPRGTDVDFGRLTQILFQGLEKHPGFRLHLKHEVRNLWRDAAGGWRIKVKDLASGSAREIHASFIFLGAGGGALPLLQKSGIPEGRGYGGFPVSGQFLVCTDKKVVARHRAKVYGKAALGAPPMSVPHLDTRFWKGAPSLLFGPYAGFNTKYLKQGSYFDLFKSLRTHNIGPMLAVARDNWDLTRYLIGQAMQSGKQRLDALKEYMPAAVDGDWNLSSGGQRVQIIKRDSQRTGRLQFGTEVVTSEDGSLASLLGASPGASTAAATMLDVLLRCFPENLTDPEFRSNLSRVFPAFGADLTLDNQMLATVRDRADQVLGLGDPDLQSTRK